MICDAICIQIFKFINQLNNKDFSIFDLFPRVGPVRGWIVQESSFHSRKMATLKCTIGIDGKEGVVRIPFTGDKLITIGYKFGCGKLPDYLTDGLILMDK